LGGNGKENGRKRKDNVKIEGKNGIISEKRVKNKG
jgi:hypothetical protein